ncbi:unnamed protein product [Ectocarpus sp. CCAP 1310/34]|nr:unnamed protein product [Ectocarpus sp. CCAP 1310/34]
MPTGPNTQGRGGYATIAGKRLVQGLLHPSSVSLAERNQ